MGEKRTLQIQDVTFLIGYGAAALSSLMLLSRPQPKIPSSFKLQRNIIEAFLFNLIAIIPSVPSMIFFKSQIWILNYSSSLFMALFITSYLAKSKPSRWVRLVFSCFLARMGNSAVTSERLTLTSEVSVNLCFYGAWFFYACSILLAYAYFRIFIVGADRNGEETSF